MCFLKGSPPPKALALSSSAGSQSAAQSCIAGALSFLSSNNVLIWCTHGCLLHSANSSPASCISHLMDCQVFHFLSMWLYYYHLAVSSKTSEKRAGKRERVRNPALPFFPSDNQCRADNAADLWCVDGSLANWDLHLTCSCLPSLGSKMSMP